jgi:hypothetical protein
MVALGMMTAGLWAMGCDEPPKAGGKCLMGQERQLVACEGSGAALLCTNIRLSAVPCRGPLGCQGESSPSCDQTIGQEGDPCTTSDTQESACTADLKKTLLCREGRFAVSRVCRGPKGCSPGMTPECDQSIGEVGDLCSRPGAELMGCSTDRKALLACRGGKLVVQGECTAPKGCQMGLPPEVEAQFAVCDYRGSAAGDACGRGFENTYICSPDRTALLKCDGTSHKFEAIPCEKGKRCEPSTGTSMLLPSFATCEVPRK